MVTQAYYNLEEEKYESYFQMVDEGHDYLAIKKVVDAELDLDDEKMFLLDAIDEYIVAYTIKKNNLIQSKALMIMAIALLFPAGYAVIKFGWDNYTIVPVGLLALAGYAYKQSKNLRKASVQKNQGRTIRGFKKFDRF
jgi:hypothetical protein